MANEKPVTEAKLISVLKQFRKDIQKDFEKQRKDLNEDFLETLANYHNGEIIPKLNEIIKKIDLLEQRLKWVKEDLKIWRQNLRQIWFQRRILTG